MKELLVSLIFVTDNNFLNARQLSEKLGLTDSLLKEKKWSPGRKPKDAMYWILESQISETSSIEDHIENIASLIPENMRIAEDVSIKDVFLDIGSFYDSDKIAYCSFNFSTINLKRLMSFFPDLKLGITCYPYVEE
jgi:hypothetical protein